MRLQKFAVVGILGASLVVGCGGGNGNGLSPATNKGTIVFTSERDQYGKLFTMNADGKNVRLLNIANSPARANNSYPRFSYDRRKIAFICDNNICLVNADGTGRRQITQFSSASSNEGILAASTPSLSPNVQELVFAYETPEPLSIDMQVWKINVNGSGLKKLTTAENNGGTNPVWSPDGQHIAYGSSLNEARIHIIDRDGKNDRILTSPQTVAFQPTFSPDGKQIAFYAGSAGNRYGISIMDTDGKNLHQITKLNSPPIGSSLAFSPDGRSLVFSDVRNIINNRGNEEIYSIGIDGKNERRLTNDLAVDTQPAWG